MSAKVIQEGFKATGFNEEGDFVQQEISLVHQEVPGQYGEWCFVVIDNKFCWVKGLEKGYNLYELPLNGPAETWDAQIAAYVLDGPNEDAPFTTVVAGTKTPLTVEQFFIVAE